MVSTVRSSSRTRTPSVVAFVVCWLLCTTTAGCLWVTAFSASSVFSSSSYVSLRRVSEPARPISTLVRHKRTTLRPKTAPPTTRLSGVRSTIQRVVRGAVRTLVREPKKDSKQEQEPPQRLYRLMYYDQCDYQPENVARILAKTIPSLDRRVAYELTSRARMQGAAGVPLLLTTQKECDLYGALLTQYGLTTKVVPHN